MRIEVPVTGNATIALQLAQTVSLVHQHYLEAELLQSLVLVELVTMMLQHLVLHEILYVEPVLGRAAVTD